MPPPSSPSKLLSEVAHLSSQDKLPTPRAAAVQNGTGGPRAWAADDDVEDAEESVASSLGTGRRTPAAWRAWMRTCLAFVGPGALAGASYVDPGNFEGDLQAGAYQGYRLLWVLAVSTGLGMLMQVLAARLGTVTGRDLATLCGDRLTRGEAWLLWGLVQVAVVGSDIQEIVGSAVAFKVLFGLPLWLGALLTFLDTLTFLGLHISGLRRLEALFLALMSVLVLCIFADFFMTSPDPGKMAAGLVTPSVHERGWVQAASILGAVIMPHNLFLHSALVLSRKVDTSSEQDVSMAIWWFTMETVAVLVVSFLVNGAIVSVFAHGFFSETCADLTSPLHLAGSGEEVFPPFACVPTSPTAPLERTSRSCFSAMGPGTCQPIGLQVAAKPLEALLGRGARILWAVGLLAAGQISTVSGTFAGQFIMEGLLQLQIPNWQRVAVTRGVALVPATAVAVLASADYMAADRLDEWLNVLQSLALPFAVIPLLVFSSDVKLMGPFALTGKWLVVAWVSFTLVVAVNLYLFRVSTFTSTTSSSGGESVAGLIVLPYLGVLARLWWVARMPVVREGGGTLRRDGVVGGGVPTESTPLVAAARVLS